MKNKLFLFALSVLLIGCDLSSFFKKEITEIIVPETIRMGVGQEIKLELGVKPEKMTIPQWELSVPEGLEYIEKEVDPAMLKYDRIIRANKRGNYTLKIREKSSNLAKNLNVVVLEQITDFTLPKTKLVSLNAFFKLEDYITTVPETDVVYEFQYDFDSDLLSYNSESGFFQAGKTPGNVSVLVTDKLSGVSKSCTVTISDQYKVFDKIDVEMLKETPFPEDIVTEIKDNNLRIEYEPNDGLFIDTGKYTILTTKAKSWTVLFYFSVGEEESIYGAVDIESAPLENTPFDPIKLDVGIKTSMPEGLISFIEDNNLQIDYETDTGLSIELKNYSLLAADSGNWVIELYRIVNGEKFIFGTVPVICEKWFSVDFYYGQRVFVSEQWKMIDTDTELLDQLKNMNNLDVSYSWSGVTGRIMRADNNGVDERKKAADLLGFSAVDSVFGNKNTTEQCIAQNTWKRLVKNLNESFSFSKEDINYNYFSNGQNQNNLSYYEYTTTLYFDDKHKDNFKDLGECHNLYGNPAGTGADVVGKYHHVFYTYPKTKKSAYGTLQSELDKHFSDCITKVKEDFLTGADKQQYDLESFYTTSTDGLFQIRKNQDGGNYSETIVSGTEQSEVMTIPILKKNSGSYSKINFDAATMTIRKSRATVKEPVFPVVRRITVNWTSDVLVYTGFIQEVTEDNHDISVVENPEEKNIVISITEKNLSDENSILNGIIGYVTFEDQSKNSITKRIEIRKINE